MAENRQGGPGDSEAETLSKKLAGLLEAGRRLLSTRASLFGEEFSVKTGYLGKGCAGLSLAAAFAILALLLFTAFIAAVFTSLLGGPVAGIAAALGLHVIIAGTVGWIGVRQLSRVKPTEFPVTREEIRKDIAAIRAAASPEPPPSSSQVHPVPVSSAPGAPPVPPPRPSPPSRPAPPEDVEARFRAGSE